MLLLLAASGCTAFGGGGSVRARSTGPEPAFTEVEAATAVYGVHDGAETSFFLSDVPLRRLLDGDVKRAQIVHVDLLWLPRPGRTPVDSSATNAAVRYLVLVDGEVGIYGGAGLALPHGRIGDKTLGLTIRRASLKLLESTDGFVDALGPASVTGSIDAVLDERRTRQIRLAVSQILTDALGETRFVDESSCGDALARLFDQLEISPIFTRR